MEFIGKVESVNIDYLTNKPRITFTAENKDILNNIEELKNIDKLDIQIKKHRNKRSLDANAYLWILLKKMADLLKTNKDDLYIEILNRYGVFTHLIVKENVVDRVKQEWRLCKDLGQVTVNGKTGIQLQCYFGSSTYDSKEMSTLIDGLVSECKELGIETMKLEELERLCQEWGK